MFSGTHALLKYLVIYLNLKQGSCPDRGQSPVEWGEIPSICLSIHLSIHGSEGQLEGSEGQPEGSEGFEGQLEGSEGQP